MLIVTIGISDNMIISLKNIFKIFICIKNPKLVLILDNKNKRNQIHSHSYWYIITKKKLFIFKIMNLMLYLN